MAPLKSKPKKKRKQRRPPSGLEDTIAFTSCMLVAAHVLRRFLPELNKGVTSEVCMCGIPGGCGQKKHKRGQRTCKTNGSSRPRAGDCSDF